MRSLVLSVALLSAQAETINDDFTTQDSSIWKYDDKKYVNQFAPVYYLKDHALTNAVLSKDEGHGLQIKMSADPCKQDTNLCKGAKMASGHLASVNSHGYGDYEARIRAPHNYPGDGSQCDNGIYGYFTAGYARSGSDWWNEINFGFHPDRDSGGTKVSVELHADTGGYQEASVSLGFNYRQAFHTYRIKHRKCDVSWWVDGKCKHVMDKCLTHDMSTRIILRTNKDKSMATAKMELGYFKFTPYSGHEATRPANQTLDEAIAWHEANDGFKSGVTQMV